METTMMPRALLWCLSSGLVGVAGMAAVAQPPARPDPRVQALKDADGLPANRIPAPAAAHSFAQETGAHQLLSKTGDESNLVSQGAVTQMAKGAAQRFSLGDDISRSLNAPGNP